MSNPNVFLRENSKVEALPLQGRKFNETLYLLNGCFIDRKMVKALPYLNGQESLSGISDLTGIEINQLKVFILALAHSSLIKKIDGFKIVDPVGEPLQYRQGQSDLFPTIFISSLFLFLVISSFLLILYYALRNPEMVPGIDDFFWSAFQSGNLLSAFIFTLLSLILHEFGHYLFARFFGISASFALSNRLFFLVIETKIKNIFSLKEWERITIYAAGMGLEIILLALLFLVKNELPLPLILIKLINQFILIELISLLWQFLFFMKTDVYYLVCEIFKNYKLQEEANSFIFRKNLSLETVRNERAKIIIFSFFLFFGTLIAIFRYVTYHLPIIFGLLIRSFSYLFINLARPDANNLPILLDSLIIFSLETFYLGSFAIVGLRKLHQKK